MWEVAWFNSERQSQVLVHWCWGPKCDLSKTESQLLLHVESLWHAMTPATPQTHRSRSLYQLALSVPRLFSLCMPFNLPALVYIVCATIRVLLAAIMKGSVSICCFLSLLLLQATAGKKHFGKISGGSPPFYVRWCTVGTRYFCIQELLMNETVAWRKFIGLFNECAAAVFDYSVGLIIQWQFRFRSCCSVGIQTVKMIGNNLAKSRKYR